MGYASQNVRRVPGQPLVSFSAEEAVHLLNIEIGPSMPAPGFVDFVPTPDGRYFVTPGPQHAGLQFYDAQTVLDSARRGRGWLVAPFFTDERMRDQYPSIGILTESGRPGHTVYRVLTSWFDGVVYRDYDITTGSSGLPTIRTQGPAEKPCRDHQLSLPILSPDGVVLAARDEQTATTKLFRLSKHQQSTEILDIGLSTGKVAFAPDGHRLAFAVPSSVRTGAGSTAEAKRPDQRELAGIFVLDLPDLRLTRVRSSEHVNRLMFPEFLGRDSIMFIMAPTKAGAAAEFRLVGRIE